MKLKFVPNLISILRIVLSITLLFVDLYTWGFILTYLSCGISDFLDGYIARRTKTQSILGAKLDSAADMIMFLVILYIFIPEFTLSNILIIWLLTIVAIRIISILLAYLKYKLFATLHTIGNKITGLLLFLIPVVIGSAFENASIYFVCVIASVSAIEELLINIVSKKMEVNRKSLLNF